LQSALDQAFTVLPSAQPISTSPTAAVSSEITSSEDRHVSTTELADKSTTASNDLEESWKADYEAQLQSWRAQSAEAREKAEKERLRWETIRANEKEEATKRKVAGIVDEPSRSVIHPVGQTADTTSSITVPDSIHVSFLFLPVSSHICQLLLANHLVDASGICYSKPTFTARYGNGEMGGRPFTHVIFPFNVISGTCRHATP
jgi:hypothetical protein